MKRRPSWLTCLAGMFCMTGLVLFAQPNNLAQNKKVGWKILLGVLYSIMSGLSGELYVLRHFASCLELCNIFYASSLNFSLHFKI